jgi:AbrB family looped-hinge helix DNA binding protein
MRIILKDRGQVTIPARVRKELRLESGDILEVQVRDGDIILKPLEVVERGGGTEEAPERVAP